MVGMVLFPDTILKWVSLGTILAGVVLLIVYYQRLNGALRKKAQSLNKQLQLQGANNDKQLNELKNQIEKMNSKMMKITTWPSVPSDLPLEQRLELLRSYFINDDKMDPDYRRLFAELRQATKSRIFLKTINQNLTKGFVDQLQATSIPLDNSSWREPLTTLLRLAFASIDLTQDFTSTHDGEDSLALRVAMGKMTPEEAAKQAVQASTSVYETEKYLRVLRALTTGLGLSDQNLIVHDTLMNA